MIRNKPDIPRQPRSARQIIPSIAGYLIIFFFSVHTCQRGELRALDVAHISRNIARGKLGSIVTRYRCNTSDNSTSLITVRAEREDGITLSVTGGAK